MWTLINVYPKEHDMLAQSRVKLTTTLHDIFVLWKSDINTFFNTFLCIKVCSLIHFYVLTCVVIIILVI